MEKGRVRKGPGERDLEVENCLALPNDREFFLPDAAPASVWVRLNWVCGFEFVFEWHVEEFLALRDKNISSTSQKACLYKGDE
jgi:hypothetical protein